MKPLPSFIFADNPWIAGFALPAALLFTPVAKLLFLPALLFDGIKIWIHELGHALIAWLSGRAATPLGLGWTNTGGDFSIIVFVCFLFLLGVTMVKTARARAYFFTAILTLLMLLQFYLSFFINAWRYERTMVFGGIGGEFYLSAMLVIAFNYRLSEREPWDFLRYAALVVGAYCFVDTFHFWIKVSHHQELIPWGSLINGEDDAGGDMNRLCNEYGWSKELIVANYLKIGGICTVCIAVNYLICLGYAIVAARKNQPLH